MKTLTLTSSDPASLALADSDPRLGMLIDRIGRLQVTLTSEPFLDLIRAIVWQQLSDKAATTIWNRFASAVEPTPEGIADADHALLRSVGLSQRKAEYVQGIARAVRSGELDLGSLDDLDDEDVIALLTRLRGVGRWTAEMFLIFALGRPDVLAVDDYGLRVAAGRLLGLDRPLAPAELREHGEGWRPYRSSACLWLWESL